MLNKLSNELVAKQVTKFTTTRDKTQCPISLACRPSGYSSILEIDPVAPLDIDVSTVSTFFLDASGSHLSKPPDTVTFRQTAGPTSSPELMHYFRNTLQST